MAIISLVVNEYDEKNARNKHRRSCVYCVEDCTGLVMIDGVMYRIVDIGMRRLQPREMYRAQGFPDWYIID